VKKEDTALHTIMTRPTSQIRWFPEFNRHLIPPEARKFLIYSQCPTVVNFSLKRSANIQIVVNPGLTVVCLCNLFSSPQNKRRYTYDRSFIFCKYRALDLKIYETYNDRSVLVISVYNPNVEETLSYKSTISLLRLGKTFISRKKLKAFPLPIRSLFWRIYIYNGYVKRLIISHKINNRKRHTPNEKPWGSVFTKWAKIRNCINRCGTNPASREPIPLSAVPILYENDTRNMLSELSASYVQYAMYRHPLPPYDRA
jgi:hypothetical protein